MWRDKMAWIAVGFSVPLALLPVTAGVRLHGEQDGIPLLTVLLMSEFGFILCAAGAALAARSMRRAGYRPGQAAGLVVCAGLAVYFLVALIGLYPAGG